MTESSSKNCERRYKFRRITDRFTTDLYNTCSTSQCFSCLERMSNAILLLDSKNRVINITSQAKQIIERSSMCFTLYPSFALPPLPNTDRFAAFVAQKNKETGSLILLLADEKSREILLFSCFRLPEPTTEGLNVARHLIKLRVPKRHLNKEMDLFSEQYNLTKTEGRLCCALVEGLTLSEYCAFWHIKISTVRSQLSNIYSKTQTKGQPDLLRLIYLFTCI